MKLGQKIQHYWRSFTSGLSLNWTTNSGSGTYSSDGLVLTKDSDTSQNWFGYTSESWTLANGIDIKWANNLVTTGSAIECRLILSSTQTTDTLSYGYTQYNTNYRLRIYENGSIAFNQWSGTNQNELRMYWNGSAMEYYDGGVLIYTGSYNVGAGSLYLRHLLTNTGTDNTITINQADTL